MILPPCLRNLSRRIKVSCQLYFAVIITILRHLNIFLEKLPYFGWRDVVVAPFNNEQEEGACSVGEILLIPSAAEHYFRVFSCPAATPPCKSDVNLVFCTWPSLAPLRSSIYSCFTRGNVL